MALRSRGVTFLAKFSGEAVGGGEGMEEEEEGMKEEEEEGAEPVCEESAIYICYIYLHIYIYISFSNCFCPVYCKIKVPQELRSSFALQKFVNVFHFFFLFSQKTGLTRLVTTFLFSPYDIPPCSLSFMPTSWRKIN